MFGCVGDFEVGGVGGGLGGGFGGGVGMGMGGLGLIVVGDGLDVLGLNSLVIG